MPETTRIVFPLPEGTWVRTSPFGLRIHPITGERSSTPAAISPRRTAPRYSPPQTAWWVLAEFSGGYGELIVIEHTMAARVASYGYAHMWQHGIHVTAGDRVTAGQHIGDVGSSGTPPARICTSRSAPAAPTPRPSTRSHG